MKNKIIRGLILQNFLYLVVFFIIYFPMVAIALYAKAQICGIETFTTYCDEIPASTNTAMNFLLFVLVPLSAIIWTIISSSQPSYQQYPE